MEDEIEALKSLYMDQVHVLAKNGDNDCECILRVSITMRVEEVAAAASVARCPIKIYFTIPNTQEDSESVPEFGTELPENARPNLERTISGRRFQTTVEVQELPPLDLCVIYKPGYPDVAPDFTISSDWLIGSELTWLCASLDELAKQNEGLPIVAMWIDWLENQAASGLGLDGCYNIVAPGIEDQDKDEGIIDLRAISLTSNVFERMFVILKNDQMAQIRQFLSRVHECPVCLDEKRGVDMFQLRSCGHFFCLDCLGEYVRTKLTDGAVNSINCPTRNCDGTVPPSAIRQVLGDSEFERFDALALSRALDSMADVEWCPRCNQVVISDDSFLARCPNCFYAFCLKCHEAYHQDTQCTSVLEQFEATKIKMEKEEGINKDREAAKQIQKKKKQLNLLSQALIKKIAKKCPTCRTPIEKFD
uniref:RBR-type E3 ubiquitin transferase n=1 Tax=Plectus sambesii TaxID=2011161 RepID=A0A914XJE2_9BILA